jgi:hypothetical protein
MSVCLLGFKILPERRTGGNAKWFEYLHSNYLTCSELPTTIASNLNNNKIQQSASWKSVTRMVDHSQLGYIWDLCKAVVSWSVSRQLHGADDELYSQKCSCGICGGKGGIRTGGSPRTLVLFSAPYWVTGQPGYGQRFIVGHRSTKNLSTGKRTKNLSMYQIT